MPISATDPRYKAEIQPQQIMDMAPLLCMAYGQPATAFGCKGNLVHYNGYHRSYNWITQSPDSTERWNDYSIQNSLDNTNLNRDDCCAADFIPGTWGTAENRTRMRAITGRVHAAALAHDGRLAAVREFAGTLNGTSVVRFRCSDGVLLSPFDSSHLDHTHASFWRSRARWDHTGLAQIMIGDDMDLNAGGIIPGLSNGQVLADIWKWGATLRFGEKAPRTDDRFPNPTWPGAIDDRFEDVEAKLAELKSIIETISPGPGTGGLTEQQVEDAAFRGAQRAESE